MMRRQWKVLLLAVFAAAVHCTPSQQTTAKTAIRAADANCALLVLAQPQHQWICVHIEQLDALAQQLLADHGNAVIVPPPSPLPVRAVTSIRSTRYPPPPPASAPAENAPTNQ